MSVVRPRRSNDPDRVRLWVGAVLLILTALALVAIIFAALQIQSGVRAYVGGEGLYSKGQKDAVFHLLRYADTRDERQYQAWLTDIATPLGDKAARLELERPSPDLNVAAAGFAQGRNDPADIQILITTFRLFRHVSYIDQAIAIWTEGDARIDELVVLGDRLHALVSSGAATPAEIERLVAQVGELNADLTVLEDRFSSVLSDGARWIRDVLFVVASIATALLLLISGAALRSFLRRVRRSEDRYRQLVDELRDSQDRLSFALDAGRMGTWDWEIGSGVVRWSESLERIVGIPVGSFGGTLDAYVELVDADDRQRLRQAFERAVASDGEYMVECRMGPPGHQTTLIAAQGRVVRDASGEARRLVGVALDVTARRELEDQLRHAQKMESVGRLAGGIAHDFNNLLTAITGHGELLAQSLDADDERQADVAAINAAAARAATLTRQLLAYGRQSLLHPEPINLNEVISSIEPMLRRLIGEDIHLRTDLATNLGWVRADASQLDQVILNLVVNARDAMPDGGSIVLATENADLDDDYVAEHPKARVGRYISVAVRDTGVGIDPVTLGRIFEPYFTTKERGRGTGLGLATVLGIVEQSGGHIDVTSEPGHGTTFRIFLPREAGDEPPPVVQTTPIVPGRGHETILLAEDEPSVRELARTVLEQAGYRVIATADADSALEAARDHDGSIDLLLTDVIMPGGTGRELASRFAAAYPDARVLYMSGYATDMLSAQGVLDPGVAFLEKPFQQASLVRKVRQVLDRPARRS